MNRKGFGLIEIIIAVAVVALLAGGGVYIKNLQSQQSAAQIGLDAQNKAQQVAQQANQQSQREQNSLNQLNVSSPVLVDTSNWKTYKNDKYGFEFKYPSDDFVFITERFPKASLPAFPVYQVEFGALKEKTFFEVSVVIQGNNPTLDNVYNSLSQTNPSLISKIKIAGQDAVLIENNQTTSSLATVDGISVITPQNKILLFGAGKKLENPTIEDIVSTLKFTQAGMTVNSAPDELAIENEKQSRDKIRIADLATLKSATILYLADVSSPKLCLDKNTVYASHFINKPSGWKLGSNIGGRTVNGTGWLPVDFTSISSGAPFGNLNVDPTNTGGFVYLYACDPSMLTFEIDAKLESDNYTTSSMNLIAKDGGDDSLVYEVGTNLHLIPEGFWKNIQ